MIGGVNRDSFVEQKRKNSARTAIFPSYTFDSFRDMRLFCESVAGRYTVSQSIREKLQIDFFERIFISPYWKKKHGFFVVKNILDVPYWKRVIGNLRDAGIIGVNNAFYLAAHRNDLPRFITIIAISVQDTEKNDQENPVFCTGLGSSFGDDILEAMSVAIGELLERYYMHRPRDNEPRIQLGSVAEMKSKKKEFLNPLEPETFLEWQKGRDLRIVLTEDEQIEWIEGNRLSDLKKVLLPVFKVFWGYGILKDGERLNTIYTTTSGCAGEFTLEKALLKGIYENIERDAFLIYWLHTLPLPKISLESITDLSLKQLIRTIHRYGLELILVNTTTDIGVPSCVCFIKDAQGDEDTALSVGGGCSYDIAGMFTGAIVEALSVYNHCLRERDVEEIDMDGYEPFISVEIKKKQREILWGKYKKLYDHLDKKLFSGPVETMKESYGKYVKTFPDTTAELHHVMAKLRELGPDYDVYYYHCKNSLLKKLGYHVVRTIIPGLVPLYLNENLAPLGIPRLAAAPQKMGYASRAELNPLPHPFP